MLTFQHLGCKVRGAITGTPGPSNKSQRCGLKSQIWWPLTWTLPPMICDFTWTWANRLQNTRCIPLSPKIKKCYLKSVSLYLLNQLTLTLLLPSSRQLISQIYFVWTNLTASSQVAGVNHEEHYNSIITLRCSVSVGKKKDTKVISFTYHEYAIVNKKQISVCKTWGSEITKMQ